MFAHLRRSAGAAAVAGLVSVAGSVAFAGPAAAAHATGPALVESHWICGDVAPISGGRVYGLDCVGSGTAAGVISAGSVAYRCQSFGYGNPTRGYGCTLLP